MAFDINRQNTRADWARIADEACPPTEGIVVPRKDNDGHKFLVPKELADRFDELFQTYCNQKWGTDAYWDAEAAFNNEFEQYMVG